MRLTTLFLLTVVLAACGEKAPRTVDDFLADEAARKEKLAWCKSNAGAAEKDEECVNAKQAAWKIELQKTREAGKTLLAPSN